MDSREVPESVKELMEYNEEFERIFGVSVNKFAGKLCVHGFPDFDIVAFGFYMMQSGYRGWRDGRLADYIEDEYGIEGKELINKLIELS